MLKEFIVCSLLHSFLPNYSITLLPQMVSQKILFFSSPRWSNNHSHSPNLPSSPPSIFISSDDDGEMIIDQPCFKAEKTETAYWTADYRPEIKEKLKKADKVCRNEKCGECEGYCEKDSGRCQINHSLYSLLSQFDTHSPYSSYLLYLLYMYQSARAICTATNVGTKAGGRIWRTGTIPILGHRSQDAPDMASTAKITVPKRSTRALTAKRRLKKYWIRTSCQQARQRRGDRIVPVKS